MGTIEAVGGSSFWGWGGFLKSGLSRLLFCGMSIAFGGVGMAVAESQAPTTEEPTVESPTSGNPQPDGSSAEEPSTYAEEILVTARKRLENVQEIPIAITVVSADAAEGRSIRDLSEISELAPNVHFDVSGGFGDQTSEATVYIRGIGQVDTAVFSDPAVGIYVDGVYLARAQGAVLDLLDIDRVEILRGPQGTLFGKNTTGGALSLITQRPGDAWQGRFTATAGEYSRLDGQLSIDVPLGERWLSKLSLMRTDRDGFSRSRVTGLDYHDDRRDAGRLSLRYLANERLTADVIVDGVRERENGGNQILLSVFDAPLLDFYNRALVASGSQPFDGRWVTPDLRDSFATGDPAIEGDIFGTTVRLGWTNGDLSVRSISAYRRTEYFGSSEGDGSPLIFADRDLASDHEQWSQEFQVSGVSNNQRTTWVAGALYFDERPKEVSSTRLLGDLFDALEGSPARSIAPPGVPVFLCDPGPPPPGVPCFGGAGNPANLAFFVGDGTFQDLDLETSSVAVFGEGNFQLADRTSLTVGLRYTYDDKHFDYLSQTALQPVPTRLTNSDSWDAWTPRVSLAFQAKPETMLYLSASRGFKSGGFNGRPQDRPQLDPFDPETVWTYETGFKQQWGLNTLNGAVFFSEYEDIQFATSLVDNGTPVFVTQNAGSAEIFGFELEATLQPVTGLVFSAAVGYNDNEFTELDPRVPEGLRADGVLPKTPEWDLNGSLQYAFEARKLGTVIARVGYSYQDDVFNDVPNSPGIAQEGFGKLDARVVVAPSDRWEVALFGTNLTDEAYVETGFSVPAFGVDLGIPGRPREWGVSLRVDF